MSTVRTIFFNLLAQLKGQPDENRDSISIQLILPPSKYPLPPYIPLKQNVLILCFCHPLPYYLNQVQNLESAQATLLHLSFLYFYLHIHALSPTIFPYPRTLCHVNYKLFTILTLLSRCAKPQNKYRVHINFIIMSHFVIAVTVLCMPIRNYYITLIQMHDGNKVSK